MSVYQSFGAAWSNNDPSATEQQSSIGRLSGGRYVVAWVDGNSGTNNILAQIFSAKGNTLGGQFVVNDPPNPAEYHVKLNPTVTLLDDGKFVIAWDEVFRGTNGNGIVAHVYDQNGASVSDPFLAGSYSDTSISGAEFPKIIAAGDDQFYVLSQSSPPYQNASIFAQLVDSSGAILGGRTQINAALSNLEQVITFDAAKLGDGSTVVAYLKWNGPTASIIATIVDDTMQPLGPEIVVDASAPSSSGTGAESVSVAALADGGFAVKWIENSARIGYDTDVWVQLFSGDGTPAGDPILTASAIGGYTTSDVAALDGGNFLVTWQNSVSGNASGLYGQVYDAAGAKVGLSFQIFGDINRTTQLTGIDGGGFAVTAVDNVSNSGNAVARTFRTGSVQADHRQRYHRDAPGSCRRGRRPRRQRQDLRQRFRQYPARRRG